MSNNAFGKNSKVYLSFCGKFKLRIQLIDIYEKIQIREKSPDNQKIQKIDIILNKESSLMCYFSWLSCLV